MTERTKHIFLNGATAASASATYPCDYRSNEGSTQRNLYGTLQSGAEINIFITVTEAGSTGAPVTITHLEATLSAGSTEYTTATNSFSIVLNGPIDAIKVEKVGASGTATVIGII